MGGEGTPSAGNGSIAKVLVAALMATLSAFSAWTTFYVSKSWDEKESIQADVTRLNGEVGRVAESMDGALADIERLYAEQAKLAELHYQVGRVSERLDGALGRIERIYADLQRLENQFIERDKVVDVVLQREIDTKLAAERERLKCLEREVFGESH